MFKKSIFSSLFLITAFICTVNGQNFNIPDNNRIPTFPVRAYVISNSGDTIFGGMKKGEINISSKSIQELTFHGPTGEEVYTANDISEFGLKLVYEMSTHNISYSNSENLNEWMIYESKPKIKTGKLEFMLRLMKGTVKLYLNPKSSSVRSGAYGDFNIYYGSYFLEQTKGKIVKLNKKNYEENWAGLFGNCERILQEVEKNPNLKKLKSILKLTDLYNFNCDDSSIRKDIVESPVVTLKDIPFKEGDTLKVDYLDSHIKFEDDYHKDSYRFERKVYFPNSENLYTGTAKFISDRMYDGLFMYVGDRDPMFIGQMVDGQKNGRWTLHRRLYKSDPDPESRALTFVKHSVEPTGEQFYISGKKDGKFVSYYDNAQKEYEKSYDNDTLIDSTTFWNRNGTISSKIIYDNGFAKNETQYGKGLPVLYIEYGSFEGKNVRHGKFIKYFDNGERKHVSNYENGKQVFSTSWYPDGTKKEETFYDNDKATKIISYNENGEKIKSK